jgi:predicted RNase H-like HicB family nuclease
MKLGNYEAVVYHQEDGSRVDEIPAIPDCYALMQTREAAMAELPYVFAMISEE